MESIWRCAAGTAGALCWCCLVGKNSGPLQPSEDFKLVSDIWIIMITLESNACTLSLNSARFFIILFSVTIFWILC